MKTTYYFGIVEFGTFAPNDIQTQCSPLAIIHRVDVVKEFDVPEDAWEFYCQGGFDSYVSTEATNHDGKKYELVFKRHA